MKRLLGVFVLFICGSVGVGNQARGQEAVAKPVEASPKIEGAKTDDAKSSAAARSAATAKPILGPTERSTLQPLTLTLELAGGKLMSGTLLDVTEWPMKTSFGMANLPLSSVAGIKFAQEDNATTTVVLHNGDSITGAVEIDRVEIETEWGKAQVNATHIASLLFTPGLKWTSEKGLNGIRWRLTEVTEKETATAFTASPPTATAAPVTNSAGTPVIRRPLPPR